MPTYTTGVTNFARMTDHEKRAWSMKFWKNARNMSFYTRLMGKTQDSVIQRITELRKSVKGTQAIITLVPDAVGDGVAGDRTLKGNEEQLRSLEDVIRVDQLRHAHKNEGRMADQKTIVNFRKEASNTLGYWASRVQDTLACLTLSGVAYTKNLDGSANNGSDLPYLEYAADVAAPTTNRNVRWDVTGSTAADGDIAIGGTSAVESTDKISYNALLGLKRYAQEQYIKPVRGEMGTELFHLVLPPRGIEQLKKDPTFHAAVRDAMPRSPSNPLFKGFDTIYVDGIMIHNTRYVYNTLGLTSGVDKWGGSQNVDGYRALFLGAQALAYADLGAPYWVEEKDDFENQLSISAGKIFGFKKPQFFSEHTGEVEDFGVITCDFAM